jgi:hypothetical protein
LPIIPPRGCTSYCRGTGAGFRQPLTPPPDPQLRWRIQFYVIDPSLSPGYGRGQAVLRGWIQRFREQGSQCRQARQRHRRLCRQHSPAAGSRVTSIPESPEHEQRRTDCSAPPQRSSCRSPHECEQLAQPRDARNRQWLSLPQPQYCGSCGVELYNTARPHTSLLPPTSLRGHSHAAGD